MKIKYLTRVEFIDSAMTITDIKSLKFAKESLDLWDNFYSFAKFPPICLICNDEVICYLFYSILKQNNYLIIHRVLTPLEFRGKRYAYELISQLFFLLSNKKINRFRMSCVSSSIGFYNKLGLNYWGVNEKGEYYCDFKMPKKYIEEIPNIVINTNLNEISEIKLLNIYSKLKDNGKSFTQEKKDTHNKCLNIMNSRYRFNELLEQVRNF